MYCVKCGAQIPDDSQFCTSCGAKTENEPIANPDVAPIAPPMAASYDCGQKPPKKKSKALLWTLIGAGAALIVAAVLIFVVFKPFGGGGPFSGNTTQTRFANDVVGAVTGAFSGFESQSENDLKRMAEEPFDLDIDYTADALGMKTSLSMTAAYDKKALGLNMTVSGDESMAENTVKMLLLEDVLYIDESGSVKGLKIDTKADLSEEMPLKERIGALFGSKAQDSGSHINLLEMTEMFLNSIDERQFERSGNEATLTLDGDALADALGKFADKVKDNKELNSELSDMIEEASGYPMDFSSAIGMAAPMLKQLDFELTITVSYESGAPNGLKIAYEESGSKVFDAVFGYENEKDGKSVSLNVNTSSGETVSIDLDIAKIENGIEYDGTVSVPGSDNVTISGRSEMDGKNISGSVKMSMSGQEVSIDYDGKVKIGMPDDVENDSRFAIDTGNAEISDFGSALGSSLPF